MPAPRKTFRVADLVETANTALAFVGEPDDAIATEDYRLGVMHVIEHVLHSTGNYGGFRYLDSEYAVEGGEHDPHSPALRLGYDRTRVAYAVRTW